MPELHGSSRRSAQTTLHHDTLPEDGDQIGRAMLASVASHFSGRQYINEATDDTVTLHWGIPNTPTVTIKLSDDRKAITISIDAESWSIATNNQSNKWRGADGQVCGFDWIIARVDAHLLNPKHHLLRLMGLTELPDGISVNIDSDGVVRVRNGQWCFLVCIGDLAQCTGHALRIDSSHAVEVAKMVEALKEKAS